MIQAALDEIARLRDVIAAKERAGVEREKKLVDGVQKVLEQRLGEHENQMRRFVQQVDTIHRTIHRTIRRTIHRTVSIEELIEQHGSVSAASGRRCRGWAVVVTVVVLADSAGQVARRVGRRSLLVLLMYPQATRAVSAEARLGRQSAQRCGAVLSVVGAVAMRRCRRSVGRACRPRGAAGGAVRRV